MFKSPLNDEVDYELVLSKRAVNTPIKKIEQPLISNPASIIKYPRLTSIFPSLRQVHPHRVSHAIKKSKPLKNQSPTPTPTPTPTPNPMDIIRKNPE